jgi:putative ubiquitin-RnfH superfamily antitoxin RatB of RatAB toxin-antitoxin module
MSQEDRPGRIRVAVACSPSIGVAVEVEVWVPEGAKVGDAVRESGLLERFAESGLAAQATGIWGRPCAADTPLKSGDRVELYRPLAMDPKEARRLRASRRSKRGP